MQHHGARLWKLHLAYSPGMITLTTTRTSMPVAATMDPNTTLKSTRFSKSFTMMTLLGLIVRKRKPHPVSSIYREGAGETRNKYREFCDKFTGNMGLQGGIAMRSVAAATSREAVFYEW